jgi:enamine deaminase RidA (YjgF/YER057c/UK114 family)
VDERKAIIPAGMEAVYEKICYAPAVKVGNTVYVSGQIGRGAGMKLVEERGSQIRTSFPNLKPYSSLPGAPSPTW